MNKAVCASSLDSARFSETLVADSSPLRNNISHFRVLPSANYLRFFDEGLEEWTVPSRILADAFAGIGELRRRTGGGLGR